MNNLFVHEQEIDPITGIGYILSAADQIDYNYINHNNKLGHDVNSYVEDMEIMYGDKSMNRSTIKSHGFLSLLDPVLFASAYSAITGRNVNVPVLSIGNIGVTPFARSIFTPYGVIEKKFGAYITTDYTPIKVGFSFGKQFKTNEPKDLSKWSHKYSGSGKFAGLKDNEVAEEYMTYQLCFLKNFLFV
uniref:Uncharacterized protein n=1 Tax=Wolbachia endosymbiont of Aleurodicus floccissimus TaxID=2152762 RepID=A0A3B0JHA6_9RICK